MLKNTNGPKKACAAKLKKIAGQLVAEDRRLAMSTYSISYVTVGRYLQGSVGNLALGINLLNFFSQQIKSREKQLKQLLS